MGVAAVIACDAALAAECMQANAPDTMQQGRLTRQNVGGEAAFILRIPTAECLTGAKKSDKVRGTRTIQVYSTDAKVQAAIKRFVGKDVEVHGRAFGADNPRFKAPIVMELSDIDQI